MRLEMFANELSFTPPAPDRYAGQERAEQFMEVVVAATTRGVARVLRLPEGFFLTEIAAHYNWYAWLADSRVRRESRQYFLSLSTKMPFLRDSPDTEAIWAGMDCFSRNRPALGLKAAYIADGLACSMCSEQEWDNHSLECEIQEIIDHGVYCHREVIHHASTVSHLTLHADWIQQRVQSAVANGKELWRCTRDLFPLLRFCSAVEQQLDDLPGSILPSIMRVLFRLNLFCAGWQSGAFNFSTIGCAVSPESQQTLQMYGSERTFVCPDGRTRVFSWHAKTSQWRIHFDPSPGPGCMFVGYVGRHLRTAMYH